ncbi:hypothetical protein GCM10007147_04590 [Nocardiopsis kunsanensis]|uniref:CRISPR-associated protein Cmr3 n=1 Tax=Nocardiopsis kunsanensis TaxID=141693 RepID=A0A919CER2_9ACTN|nr:hypothetical protein GCM10007147_04590 [Nocardiopsis kunsanensis]
MVSPILPDHDPFSALTLPGHSKPAEPAGQSEPAEPRESPGQREQVWTSLRPRDAVHVRDGRTIISGAGGAARTRQPWPTTIAGALGAAFAARPGTPRPRTVRGPFLGYREGPAPEWSLTFPMPADLVRTQDGHGWRRVRPRDLEGVRTDADEPGMRFLHADDAGDSPDDLWLHREDLENHLCGHDPDQDELDDLKPPMERERRVGIAREDRAVMHSHTYTTEYLRLKDTQLRTWAFLAVSELAPGAAAPEPGPVRLGGGGRVADLEVCQAEHSPNFPQRPKSFPGGKVLVYLATPAIWRVRGDREGWRNRWAPPLPENAHLVAAAVKRAEHVASSGLDGQKTPRYAWLRWAVPAGSVYLLQFTGPAPEAAAERWARRSHARAWGETDSDEVTRELATAGFGLVLTGTWT